MTPILDSAAAWPIIVGVITPLLISVIKQPRWSESQRRIIAIAISAVIGIITVIVTGQLDITNITMSNILGAIVLVIGAAQAAYALLWKPTGIDEKIESATSWRSENN